jgi:hypothetical protein
LTAKAQEGREIENKLANQWLDSTYIKAKQFYVPPLTEEEKKRLTPEIIESVVKNVQNNNFNPDKNIKRNSS